MPRITRYEPTDLTDAYDQLLSAITHACGAATPGERALCSIVIYFENEGITPEDAVEVLASIDASDPPNNDPETAGAADVVRCAFRSEGISACDGRILVGHLAEWLRLAPPITATPRAITQTNAPGGLA
jgi:hypothetical protein